MNKLKKAIVKANPTLIGEGSEGLCLYTFDFSLVQLDEDRDVEDWRKVWNALPSYSRTFGTIPVYATEEEAKRAADKFLEKQLSVALAAGYRLIVAPKHIDDEHHEYCAFCHVRAALDSPSIALKVRLHPIMPDFDPWMF